MKATTDNRIILTLDAGGTNFVFSAIQSNKAITKPFTLPAEADNQHKCIKNIIDGFRHINSFTENKAAAISFAFPGPADYELGILGNLPNFKAFNGNVPLGPILEDEFNLPVFINNDGNLFAYGEALLGFLPYINDRIIKAGGIKQFKNLIGLTLGTGFGGGIVIDNNLIVGDSSCGAEVHNTINKFDTDWNAEESISTRAIQRIYSEESGIEFSDTPMPKDIAEIANGNLPGNRLGAVEAFRQFGEALGSSIANIVTVVDGLVVLGGGITAAWDLFSPFMFNEINRKYTHFTGYETDRLSINLFDLEDERILREFANGNIQSIGSSRTRKRIEFDALPRTGVGVTKIGASHAIALGAYSFALQQLDK